MLPAHDLIGEMRLMIGPIVVGRGKRLFPDDATEPSRPRLSDSQVTITGPIVATYARA